MIPPPFRLEAHESLPSTSDLLAARAAAGEAEGLAILAHRQTAGRGTQGRVWESPPGNLHVSILLRPAAPLAEAPRWGLIAAVALADALAALLPPGAPLTLKWPNDLLLGGAKAAGILAEAAGEGAAIGWISLGIGVNLVHAPAVPGRATACLADAGIAAPAPEAAATALLQALARWRTAYLAGGFGPIRDAWLARGPRRGAPLSITRGGAAFSGTFAGLAEDGSLLLATADGIRAIASGEVA
ncbi:biotin--[acetyl-CoA-carboxylase] ligase [Neoroseomonas rubea]|uniref:biotin--[acetyl-CoA-carboxylase] ligase n=1 Tax=Neoroseomonas rubea TaxID=2748666 RepID=UPI0018DF65B4